jgi:hypothetical protein
VAETIEAIQSIQALQMALAALGGLPCHCSLPITAIGEYNIAAGSM